MTSFPGIKFEVGDCTDVLEKYSDEAFNCCITSPPYWGLRDYGTASWEGGDPACDHLGKPMPTRKGFNERYFDRESKPGNKQDALREPFKGTCGKCGAVRVDKQLGLEQTPEEYVAKMVDVFRGVWRVLRDDGTLWLNLGDSYSRNGGSAGGGNALLHMDGIQTRNCKAPVGLPPKNLVGIPWRVALALQAHGWILRQDIIWHKPNPMPESVRDRCTKAHEYIFLLSKKPKYYFDHEAMKEPGVYPKGTMAAKGSVTRHKMPYTNGRPPEYKEYSGTRNKRDVWSVTTKPFRGAHFATFPPDLIEPCLLAGCPKDGIILDPYGGSGTTAAVSYMHGRGCVSIDLDPKSVAMGRERLEKIK